MREATRPVDSINGPRHAALSGSSGSVGWVSSGDRARDRAGTARGAEWEPRVGPSGGPRGSGWTAMGRPSMWAPWGSGWDVCSRIKLKWCRKWGFEPNLWGWGATEGSLPARICALARVLSINSAIYLLIHNEDTSSQNSIKAVLEGLEPSTGGEGWVEIAVLTQYVVVSR